MRGVAAAAVVLMLVLVSGTEGSLWGSGGTYGASPGFVCPTITLCTTISGMGSHPSSHPCYPGNIQCCGTDSSQPTLSCTTTELTCSAYIVTGSKCLWGPAQTGAVSLNIATAFMAGEAPGYTQPGSVLLTSSTYHTGFGGASVSNTVRYPVINKNTAFVSLTQHPVYYAFSVICISVYQAPAGSTNYPVFTGPTTMAEFSTAQGASTVECTTAGVAVNPFTYVCLIAPTGSGTAGKCIRGDGAAGNVYAWLDMVAQTTSWPVGVAIPCGNGVFNLGTFGIPMETCDDGNTVAGDGCSASCATESGAVCTLPGQPCTTICGDGFVAGSETCESVTEGQYQANGDGCSSTCTVEVGWTCTASYPWVCTRDSCGNSVIDVGGTGGGENCDDGNQNPNDGCSRGCRISSGWRCPVLGQLCIQNTCGDAYIMGGEACDDGNTDSTDGCSNICTVESGYACTGSPTSVCGGVCGDGVIATGTAGETCDDGNTAGEDGCSEACTVEDGYLCAVARAAC